MLGDEIPSDPEELREDLKTELVMLHATLKVLNKEYDFSEIVNPLLREAGPAEAHNKRLMNQIRRLTKIKDNLMRQEEEKRTPAIMRPAQGVGVAAAPPAAKITVAPVPPNGTGRQIAGPAARTCTGRRASSAESISES